MVFWRARPRFKAHAKTCPTRLDGEIIHPSSAWHFRRSFRFQWTAYLDGLCDSASGLCRLV